MDREFWHTQVDSVVSTGEMHEHGGTADDHSSLATLSFGDASITSVADLDDFPSLDEQAPSALTPAPAPEAILAEFDGLAAQLSAGASTVSRLRSSVHQLVESSEEMTRDLDEQRRRLEAGEEARREDHENIARLEEQLARRGEALEGMRARLGDLVRDFENLA